MPRKSDIQFRKLVGLVPKGKMTKAQKTIIEEKQLPPDVIEYYFGRRCEYWYINKLQA